MVPEKYKAEFDAWYQAKKEQGPHWKDYSEEFAAEHFMRDKRSFPEDQDPVTGDNMYMCGCAGCGQGFDGYKRRTTCKLCIEALQEGEKPKFNDAKQVILIRKDLQMPAGKLGAQVAHASLACILQMGKWAAGMRTNKVPGECLDLIGTDTFSIELEFGSPVHDWMTKSFPKITLEVKNEAQLKRYYDEAVAAGLPASWIVDAGRTVFNGVPTPTCVGIGPASREAIDAITKRLRVYQ